MPLLQTARWLLLSALCLAICAVTGCSEEHSSAQPESRARERAWAISFESDLFGPPKPSTEGDYSAWAVCLNCSWKGHIEAPMGSRLSSAVCPNCRTWLSQDLQRSYLISSTRYELLKGRAEVVAGE